MKKILFLFTLLLSMTITAQEKQKIRIAEIEVYPEYLEEYLSKAQNVGAISMKKEKGVICIFPMQIQGKPNQIRIVEIYANEEAYQYHIKTKHFLDYKTTTLDMIKSLELIEMNAMNESGMKEIFKKLKKR